MTDRVVNLGGGGGTLPAPSRALRVTLTLLLAFVMLLAVHVAIVEDLYPLDAPDSDHVLGVPVSVLLRAGLAGAALLVMLGMARRPVLLTLAPTGRWTAATIVLAFVASVAIAFLVLRQFPNSADEYHLLFQADTFRQGRLWQAPPPLQKFFFFIHIIERDGKWVSHFPPGWALVLALWRALQLPTALVGPTAGVALLVATAAFARLVGGTRLVWPSVLMLAASPFFLFNAASLFSHCFAAALLVVFWTLGERFRQRPTVRDAAWAGVAIGVLGITRYFTAAAGALPYGLGLLPRLTRKHLVYGLAAFATVGVIGAAFLAYNNAVTGSPLRTVSAWAYPDLKLGLWSVNEFGEKSGPVATLKRHAFQWLELMEFTSPLVPLAYGAALLYLRRLRRLRAFDLLPLLFSLALLVYPEVGGNRYGPRYYFDTFPFLVVAVVRAGALAWDAGDTRRRALLSTLLLGHLAFAAASLPFACAYFRTIVDARMALYDQVEALGLHDAVVAMPIVPTGTLRSVSPWDLSRNGTRIDEHAPVLYTVDWGTGLEPLLERYPARSIWRWDGAHLTCTERCR